MGGSSVEYSTTSLFLQWSDALLLDETVWVAEVPEYFLGIGQFIFNMLYLGLEVVYLYQKFLPLGVVSGIHGLIK